MTKNLKGASIAFAIILIVGLSAVLYPKFSGANAPEFLIENTASATTTMTYLVPGMSTTTAVYDTYNNGNAETYATDKLSLAVQFSASSTGDTLNWYFEYAQNGNCVTASSTCDWYADNTLAATTTVYNVAPGQSYTWTYASTTPGGQSGTYSNSKKIFTVPTPTRYVRAVFYMSSTSPLGIPLNGAVWASFIGQKQIPNP